MKKRLTAIAIPVLCVAATVSVLNIFKSKTEIQQEADSVVIELTENIDVEGVEKITFNIPSGSAKFVSTDTQNLKLNIAVTASSEQDGKASEPSVTIERMEEGAVLTVEIDEDNSPQEWVVELPLSKEIELNLGAGSIDIAEVTAESRFNLGAGKINIDELSHTATVGVGAGKVTINSQLEDFNSLALNVGIGSTAIEGYDQVGTGSSRVIAPSVDYKGAGSYDLDVSIGTGKISLIH
ncbi:MAG: hypothetical protein ACR2PX_09745 [Endozoicomonas sp.]|uniref:hypothetical protein n=1 Tax=Endozoicomonas sp. TaxID=1892382 RepID=UPI003D9B14F3